MIAKVIYDIVCIFTYDIYRLPLRNYTFDVVIWIRKKHFQNSTH